MASRSCRVVTPPWLVYAQMGFTAAAGVTGIALGATKQWIAAFVLVAAAVLTGVHADSVLRIWLATDKCNNRTVYGSMLFTESFTAILILLWLAACIWLAVLYQQRKDSCTSTHVTPAT